MKTNFEWHTTFLKWILLIFFFLIFIFVRLFNIQAISVVCCSDDWHFSCLFIYYYSGSLDICAIKPCSGLLEKPCRVKLKLWHDEILMNIGLFLLQEWNNNILPFIFYFYFSYETFSFYYLFLFFRWFVWEVYIFIQCIWSIRE